MLLLLLLLLLLLSFMSVAIVCYSWLFLKVLWASLGQLALGR